MKFDIYDEYNFRMDRTRDLFRIPYTTAYTEYIHTYSRVSNQDKKTEWLNPNLYRAKES